LVKNLGNIGFAIPVLIFHDHDAVALPELRFAVHSGPVIIRLARPYAPAMVDIDIDRVDHIRFRSKERRFEPIRSLHAGYRITRKSPFRLRQCGIGAIGINNYQ
jgi:hypothetical protein